MKTKSHKVLVVEDEGLIAHDITARLEALGHQVIAAVGTAEEAIEKAAEADIVLMDIRLDGRADGVDAAMAIRERYHVPVVFLTAHADRATLERAKFAEPFGYIVKPLAHASLTSSIEIAMYKHRVDREVEEREARLRTIVGSVADAVVVTDAKARILLMNHAAERMTGCVQPTAQGAPIDKIVKLADEDAGAEASDPVSLAILRDSPVVLDRTWKLTGAGGKEMWIEGSAAPVKSENRTLGAVLTFRDVSARRWEERQLRQANKLDALARLAFGISSDYANLLATIRAQTDQLLRQLGDYSPARRALQEIHQAAATAEQMNGRLNAFGTRQVARQETLSINAVVRRASKLVESVAGSAIEVSIRTDAGAGRIRADPTQIEQALMSMVLHACATTARGGRLLIETGAAEVPVHGRLQPHTLLAITYTGEEPDPEKLFEPSSAAEEALALSMVQAIAVEHNGFVSAQRTAAGGCRFELLLPRVIGVALLPGAPGGRSPAILLATGTDPVREQLHNFFEAHGFNVLDAAERAEALALAEVHQGGIDVLIAEKAEVDAIAPQLRAAHPQLRVLEIVDGAASGASQIARPFTQENLLDHIRELLKPEKLAIGGAS
ncbi:MAG TPA: response regulator [Bryobacteraceae bacterium]|nr:response regulator [Bryobacteraceae bacterium]